MKITSGNHTVEYGTTPGGQLFELHKIGNNKGIMRITSNAELFLRWIIADEVTKDITQQTRDRYIKAIKPYWTISSGDELRGSFNEELYLKVIKAKKDNGTIHG